MGKKRRRVERVYPGELEVGDRIKVNLTAIGGVSAVSREEDGSYEIKITNPELEHKSSQTVGEGKDKQIVDRIERIMREEDTDLTLVVPARDVQRFEAVGMPQKNKGKLRDELIKNGCSESDADRIIEGLNGNGTPATKGTEASQAKS